MGGLGATRQGRNLLWKQRKRSLPAEWGSHQLSCGHTVEGVEPDIVRSGVKLWFCPDGCGLQAERKTAAAA